MAIWQYTFQVFTQDSFDFLKGNFHVSQDDGLFDEEHYWKYKEIDTAFFEGAGLILTPGKSWSDSIDLYGDQESNCLEVFFDPQSRTINSVSLRIDFRSDVDFLLPQLVDFFMAKELILLDEKLSVVPMDVKSMKSVIANAPQISMYNKLSNNY